MYSHCATSLSSKLAEVSFSIWDSLEVQAILGIFCKQVFPLIVPSLTNASVHAALRRFVEYSKKRCALIVLKDCTSCGALLRDVFQSPSFTKEFGEISFPPTMERVYPFIQDYCLDVRFKKDGAVSLPTKNGSINFTYHFFNNTYNAFVLLFPVGEKKSTRTKIILNT